MGVLDGKVAVITGGSRGIGRALVERLARDGAAVVFTYFHNETLAIKVAAEVAAKGGRARAVQVDMARLADIERMFEAAESAFGGVDILVNNAAEASTSPIASITEAYYDRMMAVNARGPFFAIQQAARRLREDGRIINISTVNTVLSEPGVAIYAASKAAVEQFIRVAAWELAARRITVNTVSPGPTDTDWLRNNSPTEAIDQVAAMTPLARIAQPADIADVVAFLAGPDSRWLTGQNLRATGGLA